MLSVKLYEDNVTNIIYFLVIIFNVLCYAHALIIHRSYSCFHAIKLMRLYKFHMQILQLILKNSFKVNFV
jgi:hypothetical protein